MNVHGILTLGPPTDPHGFLTLGAEPAVTESETRVSFGAGLSVGAWVHLGWGGNGEDIAPTPPGHGHATSDTPPSKPRGGASVVP